MSLRQLCQQHSLVIERQAVTASSAMGGVKAYNTTSRGGRPRKLRGRVVEVSSRERMDYVMRDLQVTHKVYVEEQDPQVDENDRILHDDTYLYVAGIRNPDRLNRYWIIECFESKGGPK